MKFLQFTGSRAEFGLQLPLIKELAVRGHDVIICASGTHLEELFGRTIDEVRLEGFKDAEIVYIETKDGLSRQICTITSVIESVSNLIDKHKPDALIVYADRYETYAAAAAGFFSELPLIHIEGGDITNGGTFDDSIRHSITKMASLHYPISDNSRANILRMGEEPWRVCTIGLTTSGLMDNVEEHDAINAAEALGINTEKDLVLFTKHPTLDSEEVLTSRLRQNMEVIEALLEEDCQVIVTYPNTDPGGRAMIDVIESYSWKDKKPIIIKSLGRYRFHSLLALNRIGKKCILAGNSSSGIKEAIFFGGLSINIGNRQLDRISPLSVINSEDTYDDFYRKISLARLISDDERTRLCSVNPFKVNENPEEIFCHHVESSLKRSDIMNKKSCF